MKKILYVLFVIAILTCSVSVSFAADAINNTTDLNQAVSQVQKDNKTIMLVFDQDGCYYCDLLKKDVLSNNDVISKLNEGFITVVVDINSHPQLAAKYHVVGTPTMIFLDSNQKEINKIEGYVDAGEFLNNIKGM